MKFDCGLDPEEKKQYYLNWHKKFAWFPIKVGSHDCRWLEFVYRKYLYFNNIYEEPYKHSAVFRALDDRISNQGSHKEPHQT